MKAFYLRGFVGFLALTAIIAVVTVLSGEFGSLQVKILASSFSVSLASICAMSSAIFMEQRHSKLLGTLGLVISALTLLLFNAGLWLEVSLLGGPFWQIVFCGITLMIGLAHGFLLQLPRLAPAQRWVQRAAGYAITLSLTLICAVFIFPDLAKRIDQVFGYPQLLTINAIAVVLLSVLVPIYARLGHDGRRQSSLTPKRTLTLEPLTLEPLGDGTYRDASGQRYALERLEALQRKLERVSLNAKYVHTNLIAADWRSLAAFYQSVFGCTPVPPERDYSGAQLEALTQLAGARQRGMHLRLPGHGESGPTLEIFELTPDFESSRAVQRRGFGHIAFEVPDVADAQRAVIAAGGSSIGEIVTLTRIDGWRVTLCYASDPEGNALELLTWRAPDA